MRQSFREYLHSIEGKRVAVLGIGVSNLPLIHMLLHAGIKVTACDKRDRSSFDAGQIEEMESLGATIYLGEDYLDHLVGQDVIFRTPGLRPDLPQICAAVKAGAQLTSEMEVFFHVCPCPIIGVTGSDGKTTTTTIIAKLLESEGHRVHLGGNIGNPLLPEIESIHPEDLVVVELSSFQLMTMDLSPHIAVITNLAPNHLDVHRSMEEYIDAKKNIFLHQHQDDRIILNADNAITASFAGNVPGILTLFSRKKELQENTVFFRDNTIYLRENGKDQPILSKTDILLPGDHNIENYMAAIGAVKNFVSVETIRSFAKTFGGVEHRIELVRELNGVQYYNDSIASSPTRTIAGLSCFSEKVILIAGGYDKHIPFDTLGPEIVNHVKLLILTGDTASKIHTAVKMAPNYQEHSPDILECNNFQEAVEAARREAKPGDVVLLSPACASFDQFKNFVERGNTFKKIVNSF